MTKKNIFKIKFYILFFIFFFLYFPFFVFADLVIPNPLRKTSTIWELIDGLLKIAFNLAIPITVGVVIYAGYLYITSLGNEKKIQQAHKALIWGLIGFGTILIAKGIPALIKNFLIS